LPFSTIQKFQPLKNHPINNLTHTKNTPPIFIFPKKQLIFLFLQKFCRVAGKNHFAFSKTDGQHRQASPVSRKTISPRWFMAERWMKGQHDDERERRKSDSEVLNKFRWFFTFSQLCAFAYWFIRACSRFEGKWWSICLTHCWRGEEFWEVFFLSGERLWEAAEINREVYGDKLEAISWVCAMGWKMIQKWRFWYKKKMILSSISKNILNLSRI
jgi:hypothetical protein